MPLCGRGCGDRHFAQPCGELRACAARVTNAWCGRAGWWIPPNALLGQLKLEEAVYAFSTGT